MVRATAIAGSRSRQLQSPAAIAALLTVLCCGCTGTDRDTSGQPPAERSWLSYTRTGGIAGVRDEVQISGSGTTTVVRRGQPARRLDLPAERLDDLRRAVTSANLPRVQSTSTAVPAATGVRDSYSYDLSAGGATVRCTDGTVPAPLAPVLSQLDAIIVGAS